MNFLIENGILLQHLESVSPSPSKTSESGRLILQNMELEQMSDIECKEKKQLLPEKLEKFYERTFEHKTKEAW